MSDSKQVWLAHCSRCDAVYKARELGMIRVGAHSYGKRVRTKCARCGQFNWLSLYLGNEDCSTRPPSELANDVAVDNRNTDRQTSRFRLALFIIPTVFLCSVVGAISIFYGIQRYFCNTTIYTSAVQITTESPEVQKLIGSPVDTHGFVFGSIKNGKANLKIPVRGPDGEGQTAVSGVWEEDHWKLKSLSFLSNDGETVELKVPE